MSDEQEVMARARKTVAAAEAMVADVTENLDEKKAMLVVLGMSIEEYVERMRKRKMPEDAIRQMEEELYSLQSWMKGVFEAAASPEKPTVHDVDIKTLRRNAAPRRFV